jgi:hypothetical protein
MATVHCVMLFHLPRAEVVEDHITGIDNVKATGNLQQVLPETLYKSFSYVKKIK